MYSPSYNSRQRWTYPKDHERNFVAAFFHLTSVALIFTSLLNFVWFRVWGGPCTRLLATNQFITIGYFEQTSHAELHLSAGSKLVMPISMKYHTANGVLQCVTPEVVNLMRIIILLCLLAIVSSLVGLCLDIVSPSKKLFRTVRQNALSSITTVLLVVTIVGVSYLVTRALETSISNMHLKAPIQVTLEYGCYTVTAAGAVSIVATACNLLQAPNPPEDIQQDRLVDNWEGLETFSVGLQSLPPPPPYAP